MAKLRVTQVEIEDASDSVLETALANFRPMRIEPPGLIIPAVSVAAALPAAPEHDQVNDEDDAPAPPTRVAKPRSVAAGDITTKRKDAGVISPDGVKGRILDALKQRPLSSLEVSQLLKLECAQVYTPLSELKKRGLIVSRNADDLDGTRRYHLA